MMKTPSSQQPAHDELAELLLKGRHAVEKRPDFYRRLWEAKVHVAGTSEPGDPEETLLDVSLFEIDGRHVIPFFSSDHLFQQVMPASHPHLIVKVQDLFADIPDDVTLMLNPCTSVGKEFTPTEIRALKAGLLFEPPAPQEISEQDEVAIGQPKELPEELIAWLKETFPTFPSVRSAHLAQVFVPSQGQAAHPLIGLVLEEEQTSSFLDLALDLQRAVLAHFGADTLVEFHELKSNGDGELACYFLNETSPFYEKHIT
jgi:hypothetical protein